jgi:hypothetical protein
VFNTNNEAMKISKGIKKELDIPIKDLDEGKSKLYTWDEVKKHLETIRK